VAFNAVLRRASVEGVNEYLLVLSSDTDNALSGGSSLGDGVAGTEKAGSHLVREDGESIVAVAFHGL
jgi:hypothetical protein